jgi:antitoxin FitA
MPDLLVRGLSERAVKRLKARAGRQGRSLQGEVRDILERAAAEPTAAERQRILEKWRKHFAGRYFDDSTALIRQDRDER